jgi:hypothetical protein
MGDRANVKIVEGKSKVFLYTHWRGTNLPLILQEALQRGERWDDGPYLARIIFCKMVEGAEKDTTGYGISSTVGDGDHRIATVNIDKQTVSLNNSKRAIKEFVAEENPEWPEQ